MIKTVAGVVVGLLIGNGSAIAQETAWGLNEIQKDKVKTVICEFYGQGYKGGAIYDQILPAVEATMYRNYVQRERNHPQGVTESLIVAESRMQLIAMQMEVASGEHPCQYIAEE